MKLSNRQKNFVTLAIGLAVFASVAGFFDYQRTARENKLTELTTQYLVADTAQEKEDLKTQILPLLGNKTFGTESSASGGDWAAYINQMNTMINFCNEWGANSQWNGGGDDEIMYCYNNFYSLYWN